VPNTYPVDLDTIHRVRNAAFLPLFKSRPAELRLSRTVVAKGRFGRVVKGEIGEKEVAVKVISKRKVLQENLLDQVAQEVKIQSVIGHHSFILELVSCWQTEKSLFIATIYTTGGTLHKMWQSRTKFPLPSVQMAVAQLGLAVSFLHQAGVIYRDLKMDNVLLDAGGNLLLADFGLAKWLGRGQRTSTICGTLAFMAPEVLGGSEYNHACDWYSLGVVAYCLVRMSYPVSPANDHVDMLAGLETTSLTWEETREDELMSRLLERDPMLRLSSLADLQRQPFLADLSFDVVNARMGRSFVELLGQDQDEGSIAPLNLSEF